MTDAASAAALGCVPRRKAGLGMGHSSGRPVSIFLSGGTHSSWRDGIFSAFAHEQYYDPMTLSDVSDMAVIARTEREWLDATDVLFFYFEESNPSGLGSAF